MESKPQEFKRWLPENNPTWEEKLEQREGVRRVRLIHEYYQGDIVCPKGTEGKAILDFPGGAEGLRGNSWRVRVKNQKWGEGWIAVREENLDFLD